MVLRYPGGKSRAVKQLLQHLPAECSVLYSPFVGGGSFELECARKGLTVVANDLFAPLYNFWSCAKNNQEELIKEIQIIHEDINIENLVRFRKEILTETDPIKRAAMYFAINRSSFSGATFSGGFSKEAMEKRFTGSSIKRLHNLDLEKITFTCLDFTQFISSHCPQDDAHSFIYADPPYYLEKSKSNLYGNNGDLHEKFSHIILAKELKKIKTRWLLSYNDCKYIRDLYKEYTIATPEWSYGMSKDKKSKEILIKNF